jgi:hypothetical protein
MEFCVQNFSRISGILVEKLHGISKQILECILETGRHGNMETRTWRHGDIKTWRHEDMKTWNKNIGNS